MIKLKLGVEFENLGEEVIVIDIHKGRFLSLNQTGYIILNELLAGSTVRGIAEKINCRFGMDVSEAKKKILKFIDQLVKMELIETDE